MFQIYSRKYKWYNYLWFRNAVEVKFISTVALPLLPSYPDYPKFETCVFNHQSKDSEVVAQYQTLEEAVVGHALTARKYGLTMATFKW